MRTDPEESDFISIRHGKQGNHVEELVAYPLGSKILINHLDIQVGGGGTNTAVAFSRLGLRTGYVGKIGKDENGLKVFKLLKKEGIDFLGTLGEQNGYSVILDSVGEDRTILTYKGCNDQLRFSELDTTKINAKAYYVCSMMGESQQTLAQLVQRAKKQKALVAFNPSSYMVKEGVAPLQQILKNTDILILNEEEAHMLIAKETDEHTRKDLKKVAKKIASLGPSTVVITQGKNGVSALHQKKFYQAQPSANLVIHETTGAGDSFGSTLLAAHLLHYSFEEAIRMAMINAESVISHYGAKNVLLTKKALHSAIQKDERTLTVTTTR